jgi:hypothetical protein
MDDEALLLSCHARLITLFLLLVQDSGTLVLVNSVTPLLRKSLAG